MSNTSYALIMLLAGIGVPILAALNANLGRIIGAPATASVVLLSVALLTALAVVMFTGPASISAITSAPKHLLFAGILMAFYLLSITYIAPHFGIGNAVFFVLVGQLISAGLIDHFGLFGSPQTPLTLSRAAGIAVMTVGVFLTQITGRS